MYQRMRRRIKLCNGFEELTERITQFCRMLLFSEKKFGIVVGMWEWWCPLKNE